MLRFLATAAALWIAAKYIPGISYVGQAWGLLGVAGVFGIVNSLVGPLVKLVSLPLMFLTLGLFAFVINAAMLMFTSWIAIKLGLGFSVDGFVPALLGSIAISIVSALLMYAFEPQTQHVDGKIG